MSEATGGPDRRAERALLTRARRGDIEALRGLLHRYASVVWSVCALVSGDEKEAAGRFADCWSEILDSLSDLHREPDIAGMLLDACREHLSDSVPARQIQKAVASAAHLALDDGQAIEVPPAVATSVAEMLDAHAARLAEQTTQRRGARRQKVILPAAALAAIVVGLAIAYYGASRPSWDETVARCIRLRIVESDLVPRFRDCVSPPFAVEEREAVEARQFEEASLVLEELSNAPVKLKRRHFVHLARRVRGLELVDFAWDQAEKGPKTDRATMQQVALVLEELANL